jgi:predicted MFS family arabinose efflux permease
LLLGVAIQVVNVLNQARMFAVDASARSRLNTAFVVGNFIGGAIGSTLAGVLWSRGGWLAVTACEGVLISLALSIWFFNRRALAPPV